MKEKQIKMALAYANISVNKLAEHFSYSRANLAQKISRETLTDEELKTIAKAIGAEYICCFRFDDGTII